MFLSWSCLVNYYLIPYIVFVFLPCRKDSVLIDKLSSFSIIFLCRVCVLGGDFSFWSFSEGPRGYKHCNLIKLIKLSYFRNIKIIYENQASCFRWHFQKQKLRFKQKRQMRVLIKQQYSYFFPFSPYNIIWSTSYRKSDNNSAVEQ